MAAGAGSAVAIPKAAPVRVGVLIADDGELNQNALKYLVLQLNCLQRFIEFEFLPEPRDEPLFDLLRSGGTVDRGDARKRAPAFVSACTSQFTSLATAYGLPPACGIPPYFIVISLASFDDRHYLMAQGNLAVAALGDWERSMAPPSVVEIILTIVVRQAIGFICPSFISSQHLGTKGCLFDFTPILADAKFKALQGFICHECRSSLAAAGHADLADALEPILSRKWIRRKSIPGSPASIMSKLGYDLFLAKGLQPTVWETIKSTLRKEGVKEILKIAATLLIAALLVWLGLRR